MRKSALVVEACPKWACARAGVNESIKSFNEREAKMKVGEEKMERGVAGEGRWEWICSPMWRQDSDLRRLSCGSDLCQAQALSSLSACLSASGSWRSTCLWSLYNTSFEERMKKQADFFGGELCCSINCLCISWSSCCCLSRLKLSINFLKTSLDCSWFYNSLYAFHFFTVKTNLTKIHCWLLQSLYRNHHWAANSKISSNPTHTVVTLNKIYILISIVLHHWVTHFTWPTCAKNHQHQLNHLPFIIIIQEDDHFHSSPLTVFLNTISHFITSSLVT